MFSTELQSRLKSLPVPEDYYNGLGSPSFSLPKNILFFYRDRFDCGSLGSEINLHYRHVLIFNNGLAVRIMVDGTLLILDKGAFLLLFPYQSHQFLNDRQNDLSLLFCTFEIESDLPLLKMRNLPLPFHSEDRSDLEQVLGSYESDEDELPFRLAVFLSRILKHFKLESGSPSPSSSPSFLAENICHLVYENRHVTICELSRASGFSEGYIRARFKKDMGISLGRYILEHRITEAMKYLAGTDRSISEIADLAGYESIYSFSRSFRSHTGLTPTTYREKRKKVKEKNILL